MSVDEHALGELLEESADLQSDALKDSNEALAELVELGQQRHSRGGNDAADSPGPTPGGPQVASKVLIGAGALAAAGFGAAVLGLFDRPAYADSPGSDVQMLQTAASIENLAVATYKTALTLPFIGGSSANPVVKAFATTTMGQHTQHAQAFNAAVTQLGGKAQNGADPKYAAVVKAAVPTIKGPADVVGLAIKLESVAAETYVADVSALSDLNARKVTASIMGVEAQHVSILLAVQALLSANAASAITLPPPLASLPGAAGSVGFPNAFYQTELASPAAEGAVS